MRANEEEEWRALTPLVSIEQRRREEERREEEEGLQCGKREEGRWRRNDEGVEKEEGRGWRVAAEGT